MKNYRMFSFQGENGWYTRFQEERKNDWRAIPVFLGIVAVLVLWFVL